MAKERTGMSGKLRAWTAALALAALGSAILASGAQAVPGNFWGVVPQHTPNADENARLKRGGVDSIRVALYWPSIQPEQGGAPDWSSFDRIVAGSASAGIDVLPYVYGAPTWAVPNVNVPGSGGSVKAPKFLPVRNGKQRSGWAGFLRMAVARYGPTGSFWAENPAVPRRPIRTWQIGNEVNFKYFVVRPNPAEYGKLVKISYAALKSVDRGARIVLSGLFARPNEARFRRRPPQAYFATDFLDRMYRATPGIKRKFIGVALHPYTGKYQYLTAEIEAVRDVLKRNRDAGKGLWLTELGWSSERPRRNNSFAKGVQGQKRELQGAFRLIERKQRPWRIKRIYWFSVDDVAGSCNFCDGSGLFGAGFTPKPAWYAYVRFAGGTPN